MAYKFNPFTGTFDDVVDLAEERSSVATLANKTLSSPVINGPRSGTTWDIADRATIAPTLDLDFANQRYRVLDGAVGLRQIALSDILTYTGSGRAYTGARGTLIAQASNAPRITFDPVTGASLGLSVWGTRTNLLLRSDEFDHAAWIKVNTAVTANATTAPDGSSSADKLVENTAASVQHFVYQSISGFTPGSSAAWSFFAKAGERSRLVVYLNDSATSANRVTADIDLVTGAATNIINSGAFTGGTASASPVGGGWYRVTLTGTAVGAIGLQARVYLRDNSGTTNYTGDGTSGLFMWGAQLEVASSASPYIPTTTAAVTAPADVLSITGSNFSKWINGTEGTLVCAFRSGPTASATGGHISLAGSASTESIGIRQDGGTLRGVVQVAGADQANLAGPSVAAGTRYVVALSYKTNEISMSVNGGAVSSDTSVTLPTLTQMLVGVLPDGSGHANSTLERVLFLPRALPSNLQALSA